MKVMNTGVGETYEIDDQSWCALPLALVRPPDGWTAEFESAPAQEEEESSEGVIQELVEQEPLEDDEDDLPPV